jgi:hypothetical protein
LDAELYDDAIPFEDTARRMISIAEAAAQAILAKTQRLPEDPARMLANAVSAVRRRDLLAAREWIMDALDEASSKPRLHA